MIHQKHDCFKLCQENYFANGGQVLLKLARDSVLWRKQDFVVDITKSFWTELLRCIVHYAFTWLVMRFPGPTFHTMSLEQEK